MTEPYLSISSATNATVPYVNITSYNNDVERFDNATVPFDNITSYNNDVERFVSISVFILFSFIFVAGLVGNGLVVMGKWFSFDIT